jgi:hypothetical protein
MRGSAKLALGIEATTQAWAVVDPLAGTVIPVPTSCIGDKLKLGNGSHVLQPGTYCDGIDIGAQAVVTFKPGTYVINRGDFSVNANATLACDCKAETDGVTFVLTSSSGANKVGNVVINGGATIDLRAPSKSGDTHRGVLFVQDPLASSTAPANANRFNGGATMNLIGAVYFPSQTVQWSGNSTTSNCVEIVARRIEFTGNTRIEGSGCPAAGVRQAALTAPQIVE